MPRLIVKNNETNSLEEIPINSQTVSDILPEPKESYSLTYERILLSNTYVLSSLPEGARLDIWLTNPLMNTMTSNTTSNVIEINGEFNLRELDSNVLIYTDKIDSFIDDEPKHNFATVASMGMQANGPQEKLLYSSNVDWTPELLQHTNFSIVQKEIKINNPPYIGTTLTVAINPGECGDLMSFMYFKCSLPPNINYTDRVGRALFNKVELYFNDQLIDYYYDDWSIIHDELFMSAEESLGLDQVLNGTDLLIPLKLFFCKKDVYIPLCAMKNQTLYFKFYLNEQSWFTDYTEKIDIINPSLIFDQIFLTTEERNYYKTNKTEIIIPVIYKETPITFNQGFVNMNMSANFNVSMIVWFIRNVNYETDKTAYKNRYSYGYVSDLVNSYTKFTNWNGKIVNYVPVIDYINIYINNVNIVSGLTGDLYYTYKQPLEHGLSIPDKTMYMYCFSQEPNNIIKGGSFDFSTLASKTTNLQIKFLDSVVPQLIQSFRLHLYYYGYIKLVFDNGFGVVDFL